MCSLNSNCRLLPACFLRITQASLTEISSNHVKVHQYHTFSTIRYAILCYILVLVVGSFHMLVILIDYIRAVNFSSFFLFLDDLFTFDEALLVLQVETIVTTELSIQLHIKLWFAKSARNFCFTSRHLCQISN